MKLKKITKNKIRLGKGKKVKKEEYRSEKSSWK